MNDGLEIILDYLKENAFITTKTADSLGVKKHKMAKYAKEGHIIRTYRGKYVLNKDDADMYEVFQAKSEKMIYSYMTAFYLHGLTPNEPKKIHVSLPQGYNASRIKKREDTRIHYVKKIWHDFGKETILSPKNKPVTVYDKERCICDMIRDKNSMDPEVFKEAIHVYFKSGEADIERLNKYAEYMKIADRVRIYTEIF